MSGSKTGFLAVALALVLLGGCSDDLGTTSSYFDERIGPTLEFGCVEQTAGCHLASAVGEATGNLDLSTFDALMRRRDVLPAYGPYPVGLLLLKGGPDVDIPVETWDPPDPALPDVRVVNVTTDIRHNAGRTVQIESRNYSQLKQWIEGGATRTGLPPEELATSGGDCRSGLVEGDGFERFDPMNLPGPPSSFDRFRTQVQPVLRETCVGSTCHSSPIADLYLACGDTDAEVRWNYWIAVQHLSDPVSTSPLLRRPLTQLRGGVWHEGGPVFGSAEDPGYLAIRDWAEELVEADPTALLDDDPDPGLRFFANRVQPVLVRKGCMFLNCHSPSMFHDLRLRNGSQGAFSRVATRRNHTMARLQLALESPNPNDSRIIAKNLYAPEIVAGSEGIMHRGGPLVEDFGSTGTGLERATPDDCAGFDADAGDLDEVPGYCVLVRWHQIERDAAIARGELLPEVIRGVVWVSRPTGVGGIRDFDTFRGGADLRFADATLDPAGAITLSGDRSLLSGCGLAGDVDVRTPAVSWDGERIAFAARSAASEPLRLYWMSSDGSACERMPDVAPATDMEDGILLHDFDPAWSPDGRIVFASTRGLLNDGFSYRGPTRTPAAMQPNANLYVREDGGVRQLTFLLNQELAPAFMADGRVIFTTEKREPDFHQLAARRQNIDGGDYHPLFAQRNTVGFDSATEVIELQNRNLAIVAGSMDNADGAGTIAVINRSIGPDQDDRDAGDRFYIHSMTFPAPGAFGGMSGAFRSPAALPSHRFLASCDPSATDLSAGPFAFQLCEIDPATGTVRTVGGDAGRANVDAAAIFARTDHGLFLSRVDEPNGHTEVIAGESDAVINIQDFPLLGTLLFNNTREGRAIDPDVGGFNVFEALPPPAGTGSFADVSGEVVSDAFGDVYVRRELLGWTDLFADGSVLIRIPGGTPIILGITDSSGEPLQFPEGGPFTGDLVQREQMQFYPGEHSNQSLQRRFFNGLCGGCHGSITGRELDIVVNVDILTGASQTLAYEADAPVEMSR